MNRHPMDALFAAVAEAQERGDKHSRRRTGTIGNRELEGAPLRWVDVDDPPVVYLPDAYLGSPWIGAAMITCFVLAFLSLVAGIVSITESDWMFVTIFALAMVLLVAGGMRLDAVASRGPAAVETLGLYLTPDRLILRGRKGTVVVARSDVHRFDVRQISPTQTSGVRFGEFVEFERDGTTVRVDLQRGRNADQRALCEAWRRGDWPPPLPE